MNKRTREVLAFIGEYSHIRGYSPMLLTLEEVSNTPREEVGVKYPKLQEELKDLLRSSSMEEALSSLYHKRLDKKVVLAAEKRLQEAQEAEERRLWEGGDIDIG